MAMKWRGNNHQKRIELSDERIAARIRAGGTMKDVPKRELSWRRPRVRIGFRKEEAYTNFQLDMMNNKIDRGEMQLVDLPETMRGILRRRMLQKSREDMERRYGTRESRLSVSPLLEPKKYGVYRYNSDSVREDAIPFIQGVGRLVYDGTGDREAAVNDLKSAKSYEDLISRAGRYVDLQDTKESALHFKEIWIGIPKAEKARREGKFKIPEIKKTTHIPCRNCGSETPINSAVNKMCATCL